MLHLPYLEPGTFKASFSFSIFVYALTEALNLVLSVSMHVWYIRMYLYSLASILILAKLFLSPL